MPVRPQRVPDVDSSCRLLIVPLFRGSSRFESLILSHHSRHKVTCECNEEDINDDDDVWQETFARTNAAFLLGAYLFPDLLQPPPRNLQ